jgi:hypothetical protein
MTTNTPTLITIKILASTAPSVKDVQEALAPFGTTLQYEAVNLVFNGTALVPAPAPTAGSAAAPTPAASGTPAPSTGKKGGRKPGPTKVASPSTPKAEKAKQPAAEAGPKTIGFTPGSDPEKIWQLIRTGPAMTSTQIREKLGLGSNIVNTTVYRLKNAGMIRPMSYNATNGDTLYTSTEWDADPTAPQEAKSKNEPVQWNVGAADLIDGLDDEVL